MSKVLVIEKHPILMRGLQQVLRGIDKNLEIVGVEKLNMQVGGPCNDFELVIFSLPVDLSLLHAEFAEARRLTQPIRMLVLCDTVDGEFPDIPLYENVLGYVNKAASIAQLEAAVKLVMAGGECFPSKVFSNGRRMETVELSLAECDDMALAVPLDSVDAELLNITPRQYEVLLLLSRGYPIKTVSRMLNISIATAKTHAYKLYKALNVGNKSEAVYEALRRGATLDWVPLRTIAPLHSGYDSTALSDASPEAEADEFDLRQSALF